MVWIKSAAVAGIASAVALSITVSPALAGNTPSQAQSVTLGVTYFGDSSAAKGTTLRGSVWRLPELLAQDVVTLSGSFQGAPHLTVGLAGNVDDFDYRQNWMNNGRSLLEMDYLPGSGSARLQYSVLNSCGSCFLQLGNGAAAAFNYYNGPYSFTVESIQHAVGLGLASVSSVKRKGSVRGTAYLTNGAPVPDGLDVALIVRKGSKKWVRVGRTTAGQVTFGLRLPKSARGKVRLSLSRGADSQYLAASTRSTKARVT